MCAALLWHLRVLAGWQPAQGAQAIRALAAGFEASNIAAHARRLAGAPARPPYELGALASAWPRLSETSSLAQLRDILANDVGRPGIGITVGHRAGGADRLGGAGGQRGSRGAGLGVHAVGFDCGAPAAVEQRELPEPVLMRARLMLGAAAAATDLASFADALAMWFHWVLDGITEADGLWTAEARWWARVEADGLAMLGRGGFTRARTIGAVAVLATDAWRCRAALAMASRGGGPMDVYDVLT